MKSVNRLPVNDTRIIRRQSVIIYTNPTLKTAAFFLVLYFFSLCAMRFTLCLSNAQPATRNP